MAGCRFDLERGQFACDWIERYCVLYEGALAGEPMILGDWQRDAIMRLFGWVRHSKDWNEEVRRFNRASWWIAKKNAKTPTLAAIGLYLLCGDGEKGQKVYSAARDGEQAKIAHTHAFNMVKMSPALAEECKVFENTMVIRHVPTNSVFRIIAGDNINSQEGLNGSVLVDETHVVDHRLMKVLRYAGASRKEPINLEVSTAGNNPDGYGKQSFDYGRSVERGEVEDQGLLHISYCAPDDVTDAELDADPIKFGRMANPTWGRIIREEEYLSAYNIARRSISELADFKMYRLNLWQHSTNPWIRQSDWQACGHDYTEADMTGRECVAALDLSRTSDMSALALVFREPDEGASVLLKFWLPEAYANKNDHLIPFKQWARAGHLELTPGDVVDFGFIKSSIRDCAKKFKIKELVFDEWNAEETTQTLCEGQIANDGKIIESGLGIARVAFKQNVQSYAAPTGQFERIILSKKFRHNRNPVLSWMAGHVEVYRDANGNMKPMKPDGKSVSVRKIDGIVACIMGLSRVMLPGIKTVSKYEREGLITV